MAGSPDGERSLSREVPIYRKTIAQASRRGVLATTGLSESARQMSASVFHPSSGRPDCVAGVVDGVSGLVAAVSGPLGGCASD
jgi:hypothetical protein